MARAFRHAAAALLLWQAALVLKVDAELSTQQVLESSILYNMNALNVLYSDIVNGVENMAVMAGHAVDHSRLDYSVGLADLVYFTYPHAHIADESATRYAEFWLGGNTALTEPDIPINQSIGGWDACACQDEWEAFCNATATARAELSLPCITCNRACEALLFRRLGTAFNSFVSAATLSVPIVQIWYFGRGNGTADMDLGYLWLVLGNNAATSLGIGFSGMDIYAVTGGNQHTALVYPRDDITDLSAHWGAAQVDNDGRTYIPLGAPFYSTYGEFLGGVYAAIHTSSTIAYFESLANSSDSRVVMFLTIADGTVFAATDHARLTVFRNTTGVQNVLTVCPGLQEIISDTSTYLDLQVMSRHHRTTINGVKYVAFGQRLTKIDWYAFFFVEESVIFPSTDTHLAPIVGGSVSFLVFLLLILGTVSAVVLARMRSRVHELETQLGSVATSNLIGTPAEDAIRTLLDVLKKKRIEKGDKAQIMNVVALIANNKLFHADSDLRERVDKLQIGEREGQFLVNMLQAGAQADSGGRIFAKTMDITDCSSVTSTAKTDASSMLEDESDESEVVHLDTENVGAALCLWSCDAENVRFGKGRGPLESVALAALDASGCIAKWDFSPKKLGTFLRAVESGYHERNPYHNAVHASDVTQAVYCLIQSCSTVVFTPLEKLAALFAAVVHDYRHGGRNNNFLRATLDPLFLRYNGESVLESMHAAEAFGLLIGCAGTNFVREKLKQEDILELHSMVTQLVLATDMAHHIEIVSQFTAHERAMQDSSANVNDSQKEYRLLLLKVILKMADISNPARNWPQYKKWIKRIITEFWEQGDAERSAGIQVSAFMDRNNTDIAKCQGTFIQFVVLPLAQLLVRAIPDVVNNHIVPNLKANLEQVRTLTNDDFLCSP